MREITTKILIDFLKSNSFAPKRIAVVGGSSRDPEVSELQGIFPNIDFYFYGIDNSEGDTNYFSLDLNQPASYNHDRYDLVLCSQVLEHIWNLSVGFDHLVGLTSNEGYLWINCPASNMPHGSPEYFSAGYSPDYLRNNLEARGHEVFQCGSVGSKRQYFMTHILRTWPTPQEHSHPIFRYNFQPGTVKGVVWKFVRELPGRFFASFFPKRIQSKIDFATESFIISKPKEFLRP